MFSIHLGGKHEKVIAVADIGSGSAGFAVLAVRATGPATILAADRSILGIEERTKEQLIVGIGQMLSDVGTKVLKSYTESAAGKKLGPPQQVYCIIRAPWARSFSANAEIIFPQEQVITKKMIGDLAKEALAKNTAIDRTNILESVVIRVELNGYATGKPLGKHAHEIRSTTFESDCESAMRKAIVEGLGTLLPGRNPTLRSSARAFLKIVQERSAHPSAYVIIDMGSEATTFIAVHDGIVTNSAVIPEGVRTMLHRIVGGSGMQEETLALMRMVVAGSCSAAACATLNDALARIEPELVRVFGGAMANFSATRRLPNTLILSTHPDIAPWLGHLFSRIDFSQFTATLQPFSVELLTSQHLRDAAAPIAGLSPDTGVTVACAFVNSEEQSV
ncbi:hypothetical protein A3H16_02545 [Candidatus Kaiserbacteria bacterium RIFCSPLOWO2_12_FULL_53_8]|uniref:SHS2 domain-containing protein n=2 Tax=Candidatus Kaiseribacteriota TaxID=1752734 RepID=A0A1F6CVR0_9BACT|nr:MAG: hypothetical protein A2851_02865 [Candidatus Kaiserbacteria bacterium RIFCSPHIGHO2_01_FULL_53_29]OGG91304.1 MAG: hypothetical protein A3H16_02545 [Candidatus Kaiserbacteria bacterium RIFCSPLOWO2_12_FULL_53_8]